MVVPAIIVVVLLLLGRITLLLRRVVHWLLLLGIIALLLLLWISLLALRVVALLLLLPVVVRRGAWAGTLGWRGVGVVRACVVGGRRVRGWWACLVELVDARAFAMGLTYGLVV